MLEIQVPEAEFYDEATDSFVIVKGQTLQLEHSLLSLSKWQSKWHKPFLNNKEGRTLAEMIDYVRCMTINKSVDPMVYNALNNRIIEQVNAYIDEPMTATWFSQDKTRNNRPGRQVITAQIIYYWMISLQIPFECQKWHLNRLLTLIRVCNIKNAPSKKMKKNDVYRRNSEMNATRRARLNSKG